MKAVVLIGGQGTRLRPLTYTTTKALLPIVNRPFLDRLIRRLEASGVSQIILAANHQAGELQEFVEREKTNYRADLICSIEPQPLGSAGALKFNAKLLGDTFLLLNGDILTDLNYGEIFEFHKSNHALVTVNIAKVPDPTRFGVIDTDQKARVVSWQEKPGLAEARSNWVNVGVWVIDPALLEQIPGGRFVSLEREVFQALIGANAPFYAFKSTGYWSDIGTPQSYAQIHRDILYGAISEPLPGAKVQPHGLWSANGAAIPSTAQIVGPVVIGEGVELGDQLSLAGPTVLGARCKLGTSASIADSILWAGVEVGSNASIRKSILGRNVKIAPGAQIINSVIADNASIEVPRLQAASIGPGTILSPEILAQLDPIAIHTAG